MGNRWMLLSSQVGKEEQAGAEWGKERGEKQRRPKERAQEKEMEGRERMGWEKVNSEYIGRAQDWYNDAS